MTVNDNIPAAPRPASRRRGEAGGAIGLHPPASASAAAVAGHQHGEAVEDGLELAVVGPAAKLSCLAAVEKTGGSAEHGQILRRLADPAPGGEQPVFPVPFLKAYRTMCLTPKPEFRRVLEEIRELQLAA